MRTSKESVAHGVHPGKGRAARTVALQRSLPCDSLILTCERCDGRGKLQHKPRSRNTISSKTSAWPPITIAMDQWGHGDYPVPPSVQENFATVAIHQRFSFDQNLGFDSH